MYATFRPIHEKNIIFLHASSPSGTCSTFGIMNWETKSRVLIGVWGPDLAPEEESQIDQERVFTTLRE